MAHLGETLHSSIPVYLCAHLLYIHSAVEKLSYNSRAKVCGLVQKFLKLSRILQQLIQRDSYKITKQIKTNYLML